MWKILNIYRAGFANDRCGPREFTVHVPFLADNEDDACHWAAAYVEALNNLRPEVDSFRARMSPGQDWSRSESVFCLACGPDPDDVCVDIAGHPGDHHGPGTTRSWGNDQVPSVPDTIVGIE